MTDGDNRNPQSGSSALPPAPDSKTGLPRPPAAPRAPEVPTVRATQYERSPDKVVAPADLGPALEWDAGTSAIAPWKIVAACFVVFAVLGVLNTRGFDWLTDLRSFWWMWLVFAAICAFLVWRLKSDLLAAGAVWVQSEKVWIRTYELASIDVGATGHRRALHLADADGRSIYGLTIIDAQSNPLMWNLIYNGILHSVASGRCEISERAQAVLEIPSALIRKNG